MEWSLPGPSEFIHKAIDKLGDRKNLIFLLPEKFDTDLLFRILKKAVRDNNPYLHLPWEKLSILDLLNNYHEQPGEAITRAFKLEDDDPAAIHDAEFVAQSDKFSELVSVIYLDDLNALNESDRRHWINFLEAYAYACREKENRVLFCVPIIGMLAFENPPEDVLMEHLWWWGIVSRWDVMQYLHLASPSTTLENTWKNTILAELAGWDLDLVDKLIQLEDQNFDDILDCLVVSAKDKGWDKIVLKNLNQITLIDTQAHKPPTSIRDLWAKGVLNLIPGEGCKVHPAGLVGKWKREALERLLRKGQSRSILPTIDDYQLAICEYLSEKYGNNWQNWCNGMYNGQVKEIGHLHYLFTHENRLLKSESGLNDIRELVSWMQKARNKLSHLGHLDFQNIRTGARLIKRARPHLRSM